MFFCLWIFQPQLFLDFILIFWLFDLQNLKDVLADLIPKEQSRIKNFRQQYGKTNIGQITVDMVRKAFLGVQAVKLL